MSEIYLFITSILSFFATASQSLAEIPVFQSRLIEVPSTFLLSIQKHAT